jgi:hypothetical protein
MAILHWPRHAHLEPAESPKPQLSARRRKWILIASIALLVLVAARAAAPFGVKWYVNRELDKIPDYRGHIGDVDLHLWRGAYAIDGIILKKIDGDDLTPLFAASRVEFSLEWDALAHGSVAGDIHLVRPVLNFVASKDPRLEQTKVDETWQDKVKSLFPFDIDLITVEDGIVQFHDTEGNVDASLKSLDGTVANLTNAAGTGSAGDANLAKLHATGTSIGDGALTVDGSIDPFAEQPTFDIRLSLEHADMRAMNDMFKAYGNFDVERGILDLYIELTAKDGRVDGYAKPMFTDLDILRFGKDQKEDGMLQAFWEALVGGGSSLLKNDKNERQAANIPLSGPIEKPQANLWSTIGSLLRNAFVKAIMPGFGKNSGQEQEQGQEQSK